MNDAFCVFPTPACTRYTLRVYDRWGGLVFESLSPGHCWDGTWRGRLVSAGVYLWVVELYSDQSRQREVLRGDVTLWR